MKKTVAYIFAFLALLSLCACNGYLYVGDGWQGSPEEALEIAAQNPLERERLTVSRLLDTWHVDDMAYMLFISERETLIKADFVTNEKGQFHYHASSEEVLLDTPDTFVLNGDGEQFLLVSYSRYGTQVWGYKYSSVEMTVNGVAPEIKTYTFSCQGKEWSIDRWWIDGVRESDEINIEYLAE